MMTKREAIEGNELYKIKGIPGTYSANEILESGYTFVRTNLKGTMIVSRYGWLYAAKRV